MPTVKINGKEQYVDGFINRIQLQGKTYALQCLVETVKPLTCPKCGGTVHLKFGEGKCDFCGVEFTSKFELVEKSAVGKVEEVRING